VNQKTADPDLSGGVHPQGEGIQGGLKALLIGRYLDFYFRRRPHQGLAGRTPDQAFINALQPIPAAA
jgi:hypothetical protein